MNNQEEQKKTKTRRPKKCDCCLMKWTPENTPSHLLCHCCCGNCYGLLRDCQYKCFDKKI